MNDIIYSNIKINTLFTLFANNITDQILLWLSIWAQISYNLIFLSMLKQSRVSTGIKDVIACAASVAVYICYRH